MNSVVQNAMRIAREAGGPFNLEAAPTKMLKPKVGKLHVGPIHSAVAGRTDHLNMHVPKGAYVLPADIVSGVGESNTAAGFKVIRTLFGEPDYVEGEPYGVAPARLPYGVNSPGRAEGGAAPAIEDEGVPIIAAGGEVVLSPAQVRRIGKGSLDDGHKILDLFVKQVRANNISTLRKLPGPKKD